jgi:hypothetical protein
MSRPGSHDEELGYPNNTITDPAGERGPRWHPQPLQSHSIRVTRSGITLAVMPVSASPGQATIAFARMMGTKQLAWTPTRIAPGQLDEFIARWGDWLAAAYEGRWAHPSRMPEHQVLRNWRGA